MLGGRAELRWGVPRGIDVRGRARQGFRESLAAGWVKGVGRAGSAEPSCISLLQRLDLGRELHDVFEVR
eukprot:4893367-Alexandrium_andersonii.AAC.1